MDLVRVGPDDPRLDRLLQLYIHEWSALIDVPIGLDARYLYEPLALYADRDSRAAYLLLDEGDGGAEGRRPLGFALAQRDDDRRTARWHVEEFFIVAGARRRGLGAAAARRLFAEHPGAWTFTVRPENPAALAFWRAMLAALTDATELTDELEVGPDGIARRRLSFGYAPAGSGRV